MDQSVDTPSQHPNPLVNWHLKIHDLADRTLYNDVEKLFKFDPNTCGTALCKLAFSLHVNALILRYIDVCMFSPGISTEQAAHVLGRHIGDGLYKEIVFFITQVLESKTENKHVKEFRNRLHFVSVKYSESIITSE